MTHATRPEAAVDDARAGYIAGLRQLADLLEAHDELDLPLDGRIESIGITFNYLSASEEDAEQGMLTVAAVLPDAHWRTFEDQEYVEAKLAGLHVQGVRRISVAPAVAK